jgi:hypothetical protein
LKAKPGSFETQSGNSYRTVILPAPMVLSSAALERLRDFAQGGGKVLFLGSTPQLIADQSIRDARPATAADFTWATTVNVQLPPTPTPPAYPPTAPPDPQSVPTDVLAALTSAVPAPQLKLDSPDSALRVMTRHWKDADVYLFFNEGAAASSHAIQLTTQRHKAETWDPQTASITPIKGEHQSGSLTIHVELQPYQTQVVVVR